MCINADCCCCCNCTCGFCFSLEEEIEAGGVTSDIAAVDAIVEFITAVDEQEIDKDDEDDDDDEDKDEIVFVLG